MSFFQFLTSQKYQLYCYKITIRKLYIFLKTTKILAFHVSKILRIFQKKIDNFTTEKANRKLESTYVCGNSRVTLFVCPKLSNISIMSAILTIFSAEIFHS